METRAHAAYRAGAGPVRVSVKPVSCGMRFVVPVVTPSAGHGGEGGQREPRPGRSGCRRDPRPASRSGPAARLPDPARPGLRLRPAGRARRAHRGPGSRSSPGARASQPHARRPRAGPWPGEEHQPGTVRRAGLPAGGQAGHLTVSRPGRLKRTRAVPIRAGCPPGTGAGMARRLVIVCRPHPGDSRGCGHRAKDAGLTPGAAARLQIGRTFSACGPFCPWVVSNSTFWFSSSDL
jgi:hypothetical protein